MRNCFGQSLIEVILAVSIFLIIAGSSVVVVLGSFLTSKTGEDETLAASYALEGLEAVQSIRNQSWDNLIDGVWGLDHTEGVWELSESGDTAGRFTREINISPVFRDEDGNVSAGGLEDPDTKEITSKVVWSTPARELSLGMTSLLTNWQESSFGPTPTPTSIPPEEITTCEQFCLSLGYSGGTCRRNPGACNNNNEIREQDGNQYCTVPPDTTCCCKP